MGLANRVQGTKRMIDQGSQPDNPALTTYGRSGGLSSAMPALNALSSMRIPILSSGIGSGAGPGGTIPFMGSKFQRLAGLRGNGGSGKARKGQGGGGYTPGGTNRTDPQRTNRAPVQSPAFRIGGSPGLSPNRYGGGVG